MRTKEEVQEAIDVIVNDNRYPKKGKAASVFVNAPLALIQCEIRARESVLRWFLGEHDWPTGSAVPERKPHED